MTGNQHGTNSRCWDRSGEEITPEMRQVLSALGDAYGLVEYTVLESAEVPTIRVDIETHWDGSTYRKQFATLVRCFTYRYRIDSPELAIFQEGQYINEAEALAGHAAVVTAWTGRRHTLVRTVSLEHAAEERAYWRTYTRD